MRVRELVEAEGSGVWVGAPQYGNELPNESQATFIVERTVKGEWGLAVRGYNNGERLASIVSGAGELAVRVGDGEYPALEGMQRIIPVDAETGEKYAEAVKAPETAQGLLVQVLETPENGGWDVLGPAEYNTYETFAQLTAFGSAPRLVGFAWGRPPRHDEEPGRLHFDRPMTANVRQSGTVFHIRPWDEKVRGLSVSAIADRVVNYPVRAAPNPDIDRRTVSFLPVSACLAESAVQNLYGS